MRTDGGVAFTFFFQTFFMMIKPVPMPTEPATASARPMYLSSTMEAGWVVDMSDEVH